ncbi:diguanylate cyclase domain-containing protein [Denitrificimonas caeni]|uniref:diguanylate cyclase domain-containing protein n=1 Tax=Denitrificimonas caeni TaxID=521720 RepID=UPI0019628F9D|nr:diguanylate cyclase [Denitrificimonas caeni]
MNSNDKHVLRLLVDDYLRMYATRNGDPIDYFSEDFSGFTCDGDFLVKNCENWLTVPHPGFTQVNEPLRIERKELLIQSLTEAIAVTTGLLTVHLPIGEQAPLVKTVRLVLIFRKESSGWKISHSSHSIPYDNIKDSDVLALWELEQRNQMLEKQIVEQTKQLAEINNQLQVTNEKLAQTIVENQHAQDDLRKSEAHFRMMTENAVDVVWKLDAEYRFTYISPADEKRRGYSAAEVLGHHVFEMFDSEGIASIKRAAQQRLAAEARGIPLTDVTFEARHRCKDGRWIWGEICYNPELDSEGNVIGFYGISRVITERKQIQDQVRQLAFYDPLTKLANRNLLNDRLSHAMAASKRNACYGALIFLDLDNFKPINDSHGHIAGDVLLIEVAQRLKQCVREVDTVARFGGDEFIVVLSELSTNEALSYQQAQGVAEKIRISLADLYQLTVNYDGKVSTAIEHSCTASIGVVLFLGQEVGIEDLFKHADTAMYQAKDSGRNAIQFYKPAE